MTREAGPSIAPRDPGLDLVRAVALILMVAAHYHRGIPVSHAACRAFSFIAESAPAFFFFAFGMTADRFSARTATDKISLGLLLLYVALAHNAFINDILVMNFLFCLWVWRTLLAAAETNGPRPTRLYLITAALVLLLMAATPNRFIYLLFLKPGDSLPFLPLGVYVLIGLACRRAASPRERAGYAAVLAGLAAAVFAVYLATGRPAAFYHKAPMTVPYILTFSAIAVLVVEAGRLAAPFWTRAPSLTQAMEFLSRNLLTATAIHYFPVRALNQVFLHWPRVRPEDLPALRQWDYLTVFAGSLLALGLTVLGVFLALRLWPRLRATRPLTTLRANYHLAAVILIIALRPLCQIKKIIHAGSLEAAFAIHLSTLSKIIIENSLSLVILVIMTFFALEMASRQSDLKRTAG